MITSSLFQIATFLSAFLLFQIELIIAKTFLPHYGGAYFVWGACVVFFQAVLLGGYLFAHWLIQKIGMIRYRWVYLLVAVLPLILIFGKHFAVVKPLAHLPVVVDIFVQLLWSIGLAFFALATVSITLQAWLAGSDLAGQNKPFFYSKN